MLRKTGATKSSAAKTMARITIRRSAIFLRVAMPTPVLFQEKAVRKFKLYCRLSKRNLSGNATYRELRIIPHLRRLGATLRRSGECCVSASPALAPNAIEAATIRKVHTVGFLSVRYCVHRPD